jgi:SLOG cluster4 family
VGRHPFFDAGAYPWARDDAFEAFSALRRNVHSFARIDALYRRCLTDPRGLPEGQPPDVLWRFVLDELSLAGALERLCAVVLGDASLAAIHEPIRAITDARAEPEPAPPHATSPTSAPPWILVAGSGRDVLPPRIAETSRRLGRALATAKVGLITGGWPGVDEVVARAFAESLGGAPLSQRLLQIRDRRQLPAFTGGQWHPAASDDDAWRESVERADAVVLIGGLGGTKGTAKLARRLGKVLLPLADTRDEGHDDAYEVYFDTVRHWAEVPVAGLTLEQFYTLGEPAPAVVDRVIEIVSSLAPSQLDADV